MEPPFFHKRVKIFLNLKQLPPVFVEQHRIYIVLFPRHAFAVPYRLRPNAVLGPSLIFVHNKTSIFSQTISTADIMEA